MNASEAYEVWAPTGGPWSPWVKPILFADEPDWDAGRLPALTEVSVPDWMMEPVKNAGYRDVKRESASGDTTTVYVIDMPGAEAVAWGLMLARRGWRPIPLYNAVPGGISGGYVPLGAPSPMMPTSIAPMNTLGAPLAPVPVLPHALVDVRPILVAMVSATAALKSLGIAADRPPVFLLDADRRVGVGTPTPGRFDNRSISLPTDFPSAVFLKSRGIERAVLVQRGTREPQEDLAHTLLAWQQGGIAVLSKSLAMEGEPQAYEVTPPSQFRAAWYRFLATVGLRRSPLGGFGGAIPIPSAG